MIAVASVRTPLEPDRVAGCDVARSGRGWARRCSKGAFQQNTASRSARPAQSRPQPSQHRGNGMVAKSGRRECQAERARTRPDTPCTPPHPLARSAAGSPHTRRHVASCRLGACSASRVLVRRLSATTAPAARPVRRPPLGAKLHSGAWRWDHVLLLECHSGACAGEAPSGRPNSSAAVLQQGDHDIE